MTIDEAIDAISQSRAAGLAPEYQHVEKLIEFARSCRLKFDVIARYYGIEEEDICYALKST